MFTTAVRIEHDLGVPFVSLNALTGHRSCTPEDYRRYFANPRQGPAPVSGVFPAGAVLHLLETGLQAIRLSPYRADLPARHPVRLGMAAGFLACCFPRSPFRVRVSHQIQRHLLSSLPAARAIQQCASWRTEGTRLAAATGAWIVFEDEAGQNLRPPKARTWAPRGRTPVVTVCGKGSGRVSVAGLVCLRPGSRGHLYYRVRIHRGRKGERRSMSEADYAGLITAAHQELKAPVILIWDRLNTHTSAVMRAFISSHPGWLAEVRLPAYAPELNPVEMGLPQCELRRSSFA